MSARDETKRVARIALSCAALFVITATAQPDLTLRTGTTVADTGAPGWRFEQLRLESADGQRRYRIHVAIPQAAPPARGFASAWLLDGNAALMETTADLLRKIAQAPYPPVLIYLGYDNDLRISAQERAYDYTPRRPGGDEAQRDPSPGRTNGGAAAYLELIERDIAPKVAALTTLDPSRRTLWGHSYGGVFVLHALFSQPSRFATYAAADPSLWWGDGHLLRKEATAPAFPTPAPRARLWIGTGATRNDRTADAVPTRDPAIVNAMRKARASVPSDATAQLAQRLRERGVQVQFDMLPGLSHGATLGESLRRLLIDIAHEDSSP